MIRAVALPVMFLTNAIIALAADQSSNSQEPGEFDIEPPILKQNLSDELAEAGTPDGDVARCEKKLERAKRNADGAEHLWKIGVLAKVEVEQTSVEGDQVRSRAGERASRSSQRNSRRAGISRRVW